MSAIALAPAIRLVPPTRPSELTLLDLVQAVSEFATNEEELIATVLHMLENGRVRLTENFCDANWM